MKKKRSPPSSADGSDLLAVADSLHVAETLLSLIERAVVDVRDLPMCEHDQEGCAHVIDDVRRRIAAAIRAIVPRRKSR